MVFPKAFIEDSSVAAVLAMHYTLQTAKAKDKTGLMRVLPILANSVKGHPFEDPFMHCLVTSLIQVGRKGIFFGRCSAVQKHPTSFLDARRI